MSKHIINISELKHQEFPMPLPEYAKEKFGGATMGFIGTEIGAKMIGSNITTLPPGKRAFPFHNHRVNEELFYILEGSGEMRLGKETLPVMQGDFISCPPGGADGAHQIINTSDKELKYLAISTKVSPEIAEYPDTGRFGILADNFRFVGDAKQSLDYWEGNA